MNLKKKQLFLGFLILISFSIPFISTNYLKFYNTKRNHITSFFDPRSSQWVLSSAIIINETDPTQNWASTAASEPWCTGSGIWSDPYIIEDVTIDLQGVEGSCIAIFDSNVYFQIKESTLINSGWGIHGGAGIYLFNTNNGQLLNNNCSNNSIYGIYLDESDNNTISGNLALNNQAGISLYQSDFNTVTGNAPNSNSNDGISISLSENITIAGNVLSFNRGGITLNGAKNCTVTGNIMSSCGLAVSFTKNQLDEFVSNKIDSSNTVNGDIIYIYISNINLGNADFTNPGQIILVNCTDSFLSNFDITDTSYAIQLMLCDNITIYDSDFTNNLLGIRVRYSTYINITDNTASNNEAGISVSESKNCTISGNNVNNNADLINHWGYGINIASCENCTVSGNTANNNFESGLDVWNSEDLEIYGNTFNYNRNGIRTNEIFDCEIEDNIINGAVSFTNNWDVGINLFPYYDDESANNTLKDNLMTNCGLYFGFHAEVDQFTSLDIDDTNLVNGKPLYYYCNQIGLVPTNFSNAGQVFLINTNNSVIDNLFFSNSTVGIQMFYSHDNSISNCEFKYNKLNSFELWQCNDNEIVGNKFEDTFDYHIWLMQCNGNNITDNSITDDPVHNPSPGVVLSNCNNSYVLRNNISNCHIGIMAEGEYNTFSGNNLSSNVDNGLMISWSQYNTITNNTLNDNLWHGLVVEASDNNDIINNTIMDNKGYGLFLLDSSYNTVSDNIFRCNTYGCWTDEGGTGNTIINNICEDCPGNGNGNGGFVPGYDLILIIGAISIISAILLRKRYKN